MLRLPASAQSTDAAARRAFGGIQAVISPDGTTIALSFQGSIARMPTAGGTLTRLTREAGSDVPTNADIADRTRGQGGAVSYTHPTANSGDPYDSSPYSGKGLPVDAALAHMNPIYVNVRGHPRIARIDAEILLKWIDRLESDLRKRGRLPGPALDHARLQLDAARAVYRKLLR